MYTINSNAALGYSDCASIWYIRSYILQVTN